MSKTLKVGLIQQTCSASVEDNKQKLAKNIADVAAQGAELVVLQELHNSLYFCQVESTDNFDLAEPIPGPSTDFYGALAQKHGIVLVTSLFERRAAGLYHNTAVVFEKDGSIAGKYRKMHIPDDPAYYEKFYFTPGDMGFHPIDTSVGRLGVQVCWDQWYPEGARLMALQGAELLIYPTAIGYESSDTPEEQARQREAWTTVQPAAVTQFFFMMAYGVVEVYVAIYAASCRLPGGGIYFIFIALATVATRILLGRAVDRYGEARLVYTGNAAIVIGILLLVFAHNVPCYLLSALLLGYSFGAIQPSLQTMAMHAVAPERRGAASSTFFVAFDFGIASGGFLAGILVKQLGYDAMFLCMIVPCLLSSGYYYAFGRRHASSFNPQNRRTGLNSDDDRPGLSARKSLPFVITISREYGSGGHRIGERLAQRLGVKFYDRELISLTAQQSGLGESTVQESEQTVSGRLMYDDPVQTAVFRAQSQVIRNIACQEPCVIVGRLANFVLKDRPACLHLFIYADEATRRKRIASEYGVADNRTQSLLKRIDQERREHCLHYTGCEWGERHYYHMMLDSSISGDEQIVETICNVIRTISGRKHPNERKK